MRRNRARDSSTKSSNVLVSHQQRVGVNSLAVDAIDQVLMNSRLHYLGSAARIIEPVRHLAILTCMDARVDVSALLGLRPGDAHVIRNAGGRASTDTVRALAISQAVMHTREVMVIHHTECALGRFSQAQLDEQISAASGHHFAEELGCFTDPIGAIAEDLERLRACPYLPARDKIRGFMYDLASNLLTEVFAPDRAPH
ncbi:MAG: carbonic anhydrase [Chloroflexi bacterium]|nr:MAG: carbonic anhydrase [Chloroflexota bacterium]